MNTFSGYSQTTAQAIARDARALGVCAGDILLVHSSLKSLGNPVPAPQTVISGLRMAVGNEGTLVFPTLSYASCNARSPLFDVRSTPACTGALPEYFRRLPDAVRSLCPTHSCAAAGSDALALTQEHNLDETPCGPHSPYSLLRKAGGKVLFLGCGCNCNTSMHAVEELVRPPYLFGESVSYTVTDAAGKVHTQNCLAHNFQSVYQCYDRVPGWMRSGVHTGSILSAACTLLETAPMWEAALKKLADDPLALVRKR